MTHISYRRGFTLMEVNLAVFIMAVAVLGMVALYPLGFKESRHARDDVAEAAVADAILNPLAATLSSTNITWSEWKGIVGASDNAIQPSDGWLAYCNGQELTPKPRNQINSQTLSIMRRVASAAGDSSFVSDAESIINRLGFTAALVASPGRLPSMNNTGSAGLDTDHSRIVLCLRVARRAAQIFEQPAFYTEVHFQGGDKQ